jgi:8-oxo-dGTP diphosphatase
MERLFMKCEPVRIIVAVGVVILKDDHILLIKRARQPRKGSWSIPGGKQELGETTRQAAIREVQEETGLNINLGPLLDVIDYIDHNKDSTISTQYCLVDFAATWQSGAPVAGDDAADAKWFKRADISNLDLWDTTITIIDQAISLQKAQAL